MTRDEPENPSHDAERVPAPAAEARSPRIEVALDLVFVGLVIASAAIVGHLAIFALVWTSALLLFCVGVGLEWAREVWRTWQDRDD